MKLKKSSLQWLIYPSIYAEPEKRRPRLLGAILLTLIVLLLVIIVTVVASNKNDINILNLYTVICVGVLFVLITSYIIHLRGNYKLAATITITISFIGNWSSILLDHKVMTYDVVPLSYVVIPILLCALFLSTRFTIVLICVQFISILLLYLLNSSIRHINWPSLFSFTIIVSSIGLVLSIVSQKDLKQMALQKDQLRLLSVRDSLTGLYNRYYLEEALEQEFSKSERNGHFLCIILLDIDNFKYINDSYGHLAGDDQLKKIGAILFQDIGSSDIACRFGGDEFVIILPETALEIAYKRALNINEKVKTGLGSYDNNQKLITISSGVAEFPKHGKTISELLSAADAALYKAKREGRDRVVVADKKAIAPTKSKAI